MPNRKKRKEKRIRRKKESKIIRKVVFFTLFIISWAPFIIPALGLQVSFNADFSIYNTSDFGASNFKKYIEDEGYTVKPLYSSLSTLNKLDIPGVLIILGPKRAYELPDALAILDFLLNGGSILISDDEGSANTLLSYFAMVGINISFGPGILVDVLYNYKQRPVLPVIKTFIPLPGTEGLLDGVHELVLNYATIINGTVPPLAVSSNMSWVDIDGDLFPDPEVESPGPFTVISAIDLSMLIPNAGKLMLVSDPSLFTNLMLNYGDNLQFAINTINWLANNNRSRLIIFDEGHLGLPVSDIMFFSVIMTYVTLLSSNWILAPLFPIFSVYFAKKWLPKAKKATPLTPTKVFRRRGESYFSEMIRRYKSYDAYVHVLKILYRKWKRELVKKYKIPPPVTADKIYNQLIQISPDFESKNLRKIIRDLEAGKLKQISKGEFTKVFLVFESIMKGVRGEARGRR